MSAKAETQEAAESGTDEALGYFSLDSEEIRLLMAALHAAAEAAHAAGQEGDREALRFRNRLIKLYNKFVDLLSTNQETTLQ